ncbi:MAG: D-Ala-D-Ala carboxypeptidase family metallohydrolase [Myxococcota bacterium]
MNARISPLLLASCLLALISCDQGDADSREASAFAGSCVGYCGGEAPSGCFCDEECEANGDCCPDAARECTLAANEEDCDTHDSGDSDSGDDDSGGDEENEDTSGQLCFLGPERDNSVCLPLAYPGAPSGYDYPSPLNNNYRAPVAFIDLDEVDPDTKIAPNFTLGEIAQRFKGRYALVQPHAIERLQAIRDAAGPLNVNSGYRSPDYNRSVGGATRSRHMYGDAFDVRPSSTSLNNLGGLCTSNGGKLIVYTTFIHCDWRYDPQDALLFGSLAVAPSTEPQSLSAGEYTASIERAGDVLTAPADGFEDGVPMRFWTAFDADGEVIAKHEGERFVLPADAASVTVDVGRAIEVSTDL